MRRRITAVGLAGLAAALTLPAPASAHGLVGRTDLPIPRWLFGWAAAAVLVISFAALATLWPKPRLQDPKERRVVRIPVMFDVLGGAIGVALFVIVVYAGLAGSQFATANLAPTFIYVLFWVGLAVGSVLFGDVFSVLSPWRAVARGTGWVARRAAGDRLPAPLPYPTWLGRWPAMLGILGFTWLELNYVNRDDPSTLSVLALAYFGAQLVGSSFFGANAWTRYADGFGVYFNFFSRLSVWVRREGVLYLRPPLAGATKLDVVPGTIAVVCTMIGTTTFDGFSQGPVWKDVQPHLQSFFHDLGFGVSASIEAAGTVGLVGAVLFVFGIYMLGVLGMRSVGEDHTARDLARRFVHTLVPIAFAYALAHYFSLLVYQSQATAFLISDPLGHGSDLFGTANSQIDYGVITTTGIWYVQVAALVCGHVAGLVLAHDRALAVYLRTRAAIRSQYWMLLVMIGFTSLGLWLLSAINR
jgi:hypothetical protein